MGLALLGTSIGEDWVCWFMTELERGLVTGVELNFLQSCPELAWTMLETMAVLVLMGTRVKLSIPLLRSRIGLALLGMTLEMVLLESRMGLDILGTRVMELLVTWIMLWLLSLMGFSLRGVALWFSANSGIFSF